MPSSNAEKVTCGIPAKDQDFDRVKQVLPYVDFETALTNRTVKRDPITGLGMSGSWDLHEEVDQGRRTRSLNRKAFSQNILAWEKNSEADGKQKNGTNGTRISPRDPIALTGDLGEELDMLQTRPRPRTGTPREPQRNPISGEGDFGTKEWDPIWKFNGRTRRSKSGTGVRSNPLTGANLKTYEISLEEKAGQFRKNARPYSSTRNIITGDNCTINPSSLGMGSGVKKSSSCMGRNAITGENCSTYVINSEERTPKQQTQWKPSNPLRGENISSYTVSQEEKRRSNKPYVYKNTLTGENLESYQITPIERKVKPKKMKDRQDPVSGENVKTYTYRIGEKDMTTVQRDISSPLTGKGSRGQTYRVSVEERNNFNDDSVDSSAATKHFGGIRNILTGENCETYSVCQEMRSERQQLVSNGHSEMRSTYNILTGN